MLRDYHGAFFLSPILIYMSCPHCQASISDKAKFCPECGNAIALPRCSNCGTENTRGAKFCAECGNSLAAVAAAPAPPPAKAAAPVVDSQQGAAINAPLVTGERRQLTVMFCDVVNSTGLSEELDPEELRDIMRTYQEACAKVIKRFDGYIAKYLGDGLLVHFGYPTAHEDDAQRAVRAGLGMLEALRYSEFHTSHGKKVPIDIRIGIHTGLVVIDQIGAESQRSMDIVGETPNIAARLQSLAQPNTLVISASTYRLVAGFFVADDLGPHPVKGISAPVGIYKILKESTARTRLQAATNVGDPAGLTPMFGREPEIARLRDLWESVVEGFGQTVLLSGEAGIGKSRITEAIKEHIAINPDAWLVETQCSPYNQNTPFYPVAHLLEHVVLQFNREDSVAEKYAKLEGYLVQNGLVLDETVALLAPILSLPPSANYRPLDQLSTNIKQKTMELLLHLMMHRAAIQPLLYIVEDLHWADPSTLELLGLIIAQAPATKLMVFLTFRPEFQPPWPMGSSVQRIALNRLPQRQTREMIDWLVEHKHIPEEIAIQILKKTDGVPLFIEELTKNVLEAGQLIDNGDRYDILGKLDDIEIPATLKDSLMARLDRLSTSKLVAQIASAIGREFIYSLLSAVASLDDDTLRKELSQLVGAELVFQRGLPPNATYTFKHALIQDAAYESLLKTSRQGYHRIIAEVIKRDFPDITEKHPESLATHYTEAGMLPEAIAEWLRAGQQSVARSANLEAVSHFEKGLELIAKLPPNDPSRAFELPLCLSLGSTFISTRGYSSPDVQRVFTRARELCITQEDSPVMGGVLWGLWGYCMVRGEILQSLEYAQEFLQLADKLEPAGGDIDLHIEALSLLAASNYWISNYEKSIEIGKWLEANYDFDKHGRHGFTYTVDPKVAAEPYCGWSEWILGRADQAADTCERNITHGRRLGHAYSHDYALIFGAVMYTMYENMERVDELMAEARPIAESNGFPIWIADCFILEGWSLSQKGRFEEAKASIEQGLGIWIAVGGCLWQTQPLSNMIEACIGCGDFERAWKAVEEIHRIQRENKESFYVPETLRWEGELILAQAKVEREKGGHVQVSGPSPEEQAEALFQKSLEEARRTGAKSFEMLTLQSLHKLKVGTSAEPEITGMIAELLSQFTEGHNTPLLMRAKAIVDSKSVKSIREAA